MTAPAPAPPTVTHTLDHVGLSVPDLGQAVDFFVDHFGARTLFSLGRPQSAAAPTVPAAGRRAPAGPNGSQRLGAAAAAQFALTMLQVGTARLELLQWWTDRPAGPVPEADQAGGAHVALEVHDVAAALERLRQVPGVSVVGEPLEFAAGETPGLVNAFLRAPWGLLIELVHWTGATGTDRYNRLVQEVRDDQR